LGYADDSESVEMIMKKFELLEKKLQEISQRHATEVTNNNPNPKAEEVSILSIVYHSSQYYRRN
jgi:hypothetical protein